MTPNQLPPLPEIDPVLGHPEHHMKWTPTEIKWIQKYATDYALAALTQQAQEREPVAAVLGDIVALWDLYAPSQHMTAMHMHAKRALAGQQPVSPDMHRWCAYVGVMVAHWVMSEPNAHVRLGDDQFEAAIAGIIERRLWAMPKRDTAPQPQPAPPVPAPVDERAAFKAELAVMPEWEPDFKHHRAWVEPLLWVFWQARATLSKPAPLAGEVTDGELNPRRAYEFGQLITKYSDSFNDQDWGGINESVDRKNLAMALDHLTQAGAMLMNVSERLEQTNRAILALRPQAVPMTELHPLMIFARECELGTYMEHETPMAARKAINAAKACGITAKAEGGEKP